MIHVYQSHAHMESILVFFEHFFINNDYFSLIADEEIAGCCTLLCYCFLFAFLCLSVSTFSHSRCHGLVIDYGIFWSYSLLHGHSNRTFKSTMKLKLSKNKQAFN